MDPPVSFEDNPLAAEGPAHVADADEVAGRQAVEHADLAAEEGRLAAETHRADAEAVGRFHDVFFQTREGWHAVPVVEMTEELLLGVQIAGRAVAADANPEDAGAAAFALRLENGVEDRAAAALEVAVRAELFVGQRILGADVFAAAALEDEAHLGAVAAGLFEMEGGRAGAEVGAVVLSRERIHGVLAEISLAGGGKDGGARVALKGDLIEAARDADEKENRSGVLADGLRFVFCECDVAADDLERLFGDGVFRFCAQGAKDRPMDVIRNLGRRAAEEFEERDAKVFHCGTAQFITKSRGLAILFPGMPPLFAKQTILHTEASEGWGGQEIRVMIEMREMAKRGHRTILVAPPSSDIFRRGLDARIETHPLSMRRQDFFSNLRWLSDFLRAEKVTVVNTHSSRDSWLAGCAARRARTPLVIKTRHISAPISRGWLTRLVYQRMHDFIITTSEGIARDMVRFNGFDPQRIAAVPTGVDLSLFDCGQRRRRLREELGLPPDALLVGMVSVLRSWKGHPDLLHAAQLVKARVPSAYFVIAGEGPRRANIEADLLRMNLEDYVFLIGHRDQVPQVLCDLDLFVLPSYANEGVPQALLQALAMKRPVVATAIGGIPEVITSGVEGLLCEPNQPDVLAENILRVLTDPELARALAERGRARVTERYSLERMIAKLEEIYAARLNGAAVV